MLSGAAVMDGALLVIAADEPCPQPQTREHLAAIEIVGIRKLIIVQNKIDIVDERRALESYKEITNFVKGSIAEKAPIIPVSAQHRVNIDVLLQAFEENIPTPHRDLGKPPRMYVVRSFDVNKPGTLVEELVGGVIGGSLLQGKFTSGDEIEIRPGIRVEKQGKIFYESLFTEIASLHTGGRTVKEAQCGGLIGMGTFLDPSLTKADSLIGNLVGKPETLPPTRSELTLETFLFERMLGMKELLQVEKPIKGDSLLLDVGTAITVGTVISAREDITVFQLARPVCVDEGFMTAISRKVAGRWRLIGYGTIKNK
jgi:translation initiation factor 2 subunit 3